jgi:hypothetical protein
LPVAGELPPQSAERIAQDGCKPSGRSASPDDKMFRIGAGIGLVAFHDGSVDLPAHARRRRCPLHREEEWSQSHPCIKRRTGNLAQGESGLVGRDFVGR